MFIDVQGYNGPYNSFILKEFAILWETNEVQHFIVQSPYNFTNLPPHLQKQANYMCEKHHGIGWNCGFTSLDTIITCFSEMIKGQTIYVKGKSKVKWIRDLFKLDDSVIIRNLDEDGYPNIENLRRMFPHTQRCILHNGVCALQNVKMLLNYQQQEQNI